MGIASKEQKAPIPYTREEVILAVLLRVHVTQ
jgi:hypothetical protein